MIVTSDQDFLRFNRQSQDHAGIAFCKDPERSIGDLATMMAVIHATYTAEQMIGRVEYL